MRINLVTRFVDKDTVKDLGARWDPAKKLWYITDMADLTPFMRWIPDMDAAVETSSNNGPGSKAATPKVRVDQSSGITTKSVVEVPHCGCDVLPWEDCEHTAKS